MNPFLFGLAKIREKKWCSTSRMPKKVTFFHPFPVFLQLSGPSGAPKMEIHWSCVSISLATFKASFSLCTRPVLHETLMHLADLMLRISWHQKVKKILLSYNLFTKKFTAGGCHIGVQVSVVQELLCRYDTVLTILVFEHAIWGRHSVLCMRIKHSEETTFLAILLWQLSTSIWGCPFNCQMPRKVIRLGLGWSDHLK